MASIIDTSSIKNITEYPNSFKRQGAFPLERYSLFNSVSDAETYASTNPIAYVGQPLVVVSDFGDWEFSDEGTHEVTWDSENSKWILDAGTAGEIEVAGIQTDLSVEFSGSLTATRTPKSVRCFVIGLDSSLVELAYAADASGDLDDAIAALDSSVAATAADGNKYSVLTGITETDGKLTGKTEVKLEAVAKTGAASDVSIADAGSLITATNVEDALQEVATSINDNAVTMTTSDGSADSGILKTYSIWAGGTTSANVNTGGTKIGDINIPKDFLVKSGSLKTVETADTPYTGAAVGDKYIELVLNVKSGSETDSKVYIPVNDLFDSYTSDDTASTPIQITVNNSTNKISATCNITGSAVIATESNGVVTIKAGVAQSGGVVSQGSGSDITLAKVATTGDSEDVAYGETTVEATLDTITGDNTTAGSIAKAEKDAKDYAAGLVNALDTTADVGIASVTSNVVTIKGSVKQENGLIAQGSASDVVLEEVAVTGAAADVSIADAGSVITATTVEGALQEIATEIDNMDVASFALASKDSTTNVITIKGLQETDGKVAADTSSNTLTLAAVAATGKASDVAIDDTGSLITAGTVEGALAEIAAEIDGMDADKDASSSDSAVTTITSVAVMTGVTQVDGKITAVDSALADKYGSAASVLGDATNDTRTTATVQGVKKLAAAKAEYLGTATALTTTSATVTVGGASVTASLGDYVTYSGVEYFWDGTEWKKLSGVKSVSFAGTSLTVGNNGALSISKSDALTALNVEDGAQVNIVDGAVDANGTALTINSSKKLVLNNLILDGGSASATIA